MITSDKQHEAAKEQLRMLKNSLISSRKNDIPTIIEKAAKSQIQELINEVESNMNEYIKLIKNRSATIKIYSLYLSVK